jgi:hypothetical protein
MRRCHFRYGGIGRRGGPGVVRGLGAAVAGRDCGLRGMRGVQTGTVKSELQAPWSDVCAGSSMPLAVICRLLELGLRQPAQNMPSSARPVAGSAPSQGFATIARFVRTTCIPHNGVAQQVIAAPAVHVVYTEVHTPQCRCLGTATDTRYLQEGEGGRAQHRSQAAEGCAAIWARWYVWKT